MNVQENLLTWQGLQEEILLYLVQRDAVSWGKAVEVMTFHIISFFFFFFLHSSFSIFLVFLSWFTGYFCIDFYTGYPIHNYFSCKVEFMKIFVLGKLFPAAWNVFRIDVFSLKHGFVKITFLFSPINFHIGSIDDFILAWCLFLVGPYKAKRRTIFTVQCSCTFLPLNLTFPQKLQTLVLQQIPSCVAFYPFSVSSTIS